jgi:hypothetical protein
MRILAICEVVVAFRPISLSASTQQQPQTATLDPCKVIANPEKYAGQIVEMRGVMS